MVDDALGPGVAGCVVGLAAADAEGDTLLLGLAGVAGAAWSGVLVASGCDAVVASSPSVLPPDGASENQVIPPIAVAPAATAAMDHRVRGVGGI